MGKRRDKGEGDCPGPTRGNSVSSIVEENSKIF